MKLAIISDIHANLEALTATLQSISGQDVDRTVVLGDVVGYNANPSECIALIRESGALCVGGNHDRAVAGVIPTEGFGHNAAIAIEWTRWQLSADALDYLASLPLEISVDSHLVAVHGALLSDGGCELSRLDTEERRRPSYEALMAHQSGARVCAFGNTHRVGIFEFRDGTEGLWNGEDVTLRDDSYYLVNPGTVGEPRGRDRRATYLMFDTARRTLSVHRVSYDSARAIAKARKAGLLPFYANFPTPVRRPIRWAANAIGLRDFAKHIAVLHQRRRRAVRTLPPT